MIGLSRMLLAAVLVVGLVAGCGTASPTASPGGATAAPSSVVAPPTSVRIPQIAARSTLIRTGMVDDPQTAQVERIPEVPSVNEPMQASWATWSPKPGEPGPAVLYGHVNGEQGGRAGAPGIFADLTKLQPGNVIFVDRADGSTAVFEVTRVKTYPKAALDTAESGPAAAREVYGDVAGPQLRLVTCGGAFDRDAGSYLDQVVAFATLAGQVPAP